MARSCPGLKACSTRSESNPDHLLALCLVQIYLLFPAVPHVFTGDNRVVLKIQADIAYQGFNRMPRLW